MKNKAVEALFRAQFNIPEEVHVGVLFLAVVGEVYEFYVEYSFLGNNYECKIKLNSLSLDDLTVRKIG